MARLYYKEKLISFWLVGGTQMISSAGGHNTMVCSLVSGTPRAPFTWFQLPSGNLKWLMDTQIPQDFAHCKAKIFFAS